MPPIATIFQPYGSRKHSKKAIMASVSTVSSLQQWPNHQLDLGFRVQIVQPILIICGDGLEARRMFVIDCFQEFLVPVHNAFLLLIHQQPWHLASWLLAEAQMVMDYPVKTCRRNSQLYLHLPDGQTAITFQEFTNFVDIVWVSWHPGPLLTKFINIWNDYC